jgi:SAM-dependent methyltransferase
MVHAGAEFWDDFYRRERGSGDDLDWAGEWTRPFLAPLREAGVRTVLELGCGTGNDAARLAAEGYSVTAVDLSGEAIGRARARFSPPATFLVADVTRPLPFPDGAFGSDSGFRTVDAVVGAAVIGRRTFDLGVGPWGGTPWPGVPGFVVTHRTREDLLGDNGRPGAGRARRRAAAQGGPATASRSPDA